uniref:Uncharacterized protein n=1 Tax=Rhizophora mucronata TaxID=61149 RepID=A0A2P2PFC4_RHIMU
MKIPTTNTILVTAIISMIGSIQSISVSPTE